MKRLFLSWMLFVHHFMLIGQANLEQSHWWQQYLELQSETASDIDVNELNFQLQELQLHPVVLDSAHLHQLFFLSETEKAAIFQHLQSFGKIISIYELQVIDALPPEIFPILSKCIQIQPLQIHQEPFRNWLSEGQHECLVQTETSLPKAKGYRSIGDEEPYYLGSAHRSLVRYRFQFKQQLYFGFGAKKDKGEPLGSGNFASFHALYRGQGWIKTLAMGDFQALFGLGLTFASRPAMGKGAQVLQTNGRLNGIQPYRSLSEFGYLRGVAIGAGNKQIKVDVLLSKLLVIHAQKISANSKIGVIGRAGVQSIGSGFGFEPNLRYGFYVFKTIQNASIQAEVAMENAHLSAIVQVLKPLHQSIDYLFLYRNYKGWVEPNFVGAWSEYAGLNNETGVYQGLSFKVNRKWLLQAYQDLYWAYLPRFQKQLGARGVEWFGVAQYKLSKTSIWEFRYQLKVTEKDAEGHLLLEKSWQKQQKLRLQCTHQVTKKAQIRIRYDWNIWQQFEGSGLLLEGSWQPEKSKWSVFARYVSFNSARDETSIYALERDVPYQYTLGRFNGIGSNLYILTRFEPSKQWDIFFKIGHLRQADGSLPGSGWDEIDQPNLTKFSFQVRRRW